MKKCILFIFIVLFPAGVFSQEQQVIFENFSTQQGLPTPLIKTVIQDKDGFIWCGSANAIHRFDGFSFKTFKYEPGKKNTITKGVVNIMYEDRKGNLWAGTSSGLNKFDRFTGDFLQYAPADPSAPIFKFDIQSVFEDSKGILWVGSMMGLNSMDSSFEKLQPFTSEKFKEILPNIAFKSINEDNQGNLWFGTGIGLMKYDRNTNELTPVWIDKNPPGLTSKTWNTGDYAVQCIYKDEAGILWVGSFGGTVIKLNPVTGLMDFYSLKDSKTSEVFPVQSICPENENELWVATYSGLILFDKKTGTVLAHYVYDENSKESLRDSKTTAVLKDRSGTLWVSTLSAGLHKLNRTKFQFNKFMRKSWAADKSYIQVPFKDMIISRSGSLFVGTTAGIEEINPGSFEIIRHAPYDAINVLMEDSKGNFWIAKKQYSGGGMYKKDPSGNLTPVLDSAGAVFSKEIHCLYETERGKIYFASEFYLYGIDTENNTANLVFRTNRRIYSICEDINNVLCLGTMAGGLFFFNPDTKTVIKHFMPDEKNPAGISDNSVIHIFLDSRKTLWLGTGLGLDKYVRETGGFEVYDDRKGLGHNVVLNISEDNSGNLWIGTGTGISKFNPETGEIKNYDMSYGLVESYHYAGGKSKTGEMFFKARTGITYFHPDSIKDNPFIPPIVITEMKVFNNPYPVTKEIKLAHSENYVSLEFSALSFISPEKNKYAYIMEGVDRDWVSAGSRRYAAYTSLNPGSYTFRVRASNNDGVWNNEGTSLSIIILPPWYKTYWAYSLYAFILIMLFYAWRKYDLKRQNLKYQVKLEHENARKQEEISRMKSRFFTNISHEFRTPLTLIIGPAENIISSGDPDSRKQAGILKRNALHLLGLVNQLLDMSKLDEGKLKLEVSQGNLVSFIRGIVMIFESFAESKDVILKVKPDREEINGLFDRDKLEKILINLISNALKFTNEGGKIIVTISETDNGLATIKVKDTGIGIKPSELTKLFNRFYQVDSSHTREHGGTGIGLALTKELVELHRGNISVDSREGEWTEFTVELPIGRDFYKDEDIVETGEKHFSGDKYTVLAEQVDAGFKSSLPSSVVHSHGTGGGNGDGEKQIILVVEDNEDVRQYIKDSLGNEYIIEEAGNGEQGYRKAEAIIPDLIIGDIMMPKMDGYEMTKKLREDEKTFHIPVILLTAKSDHKSKLEGFESGADAYLVKPFDTNELRIRITNLINIRKKLQEKFAKGEKIPVRVHEEKKLSDLNEKFINRVIDVMEKHLGEEEFSVEEFSRELCMSRTQLHRKLKALTGKSASRYLRSFRLSAAKKMIEEGKGNISEIAYDVGFSSPVYFSKCFKDEYGHTPSELTPS